MSLVNGVAEGKWVKVTKCKMQGSFLFVQTLKFILGRLFLFAFQDGLHYDSAWREEILLVVDSCG
ncbi:hypothetical protein VP01_5415g3, partial [Puccinia sorghi]